MRCGIIHCTDCVGCGHHYCGCGQGCRCDSTRKRRPLRRGPPPNLDVPR